MFVHCIHLAKTYWFYSMLFTETILFCSFVCNFLMMKASYCETGLIMIKCHLNFFLSHRSNSLIFVKLCHISFGKKKFPQVWSCCHFQGKCGLKLKPNKLLCCTAEFVQMIIFLMHLKLQEGFML